MQPEALPQEMLSHTPETTDTVVIKGRKCGSDLIGLLVTIRAGG